MTPVTTVERLKMDLPFVNVSRVQTSTQRSAGPLIGMGLPGATRAKELGLFRTAAIIMSLFQTLMQATPIVVCVFTLGLYALLGNEITASTGASACLGVCAWLCVVCAGHQRPGAGIAG